ncbi:MAG: hypothetical protein C0592_02015 [Marinilabiliales bacterium]|nr:MAG: hypothetical protein C0592_02015 [Marinilabiliales bacterium]
MKKILLYIFASLILYISGNSQGLGIDGAFNLSKVSGDPWGIRQKFSPGFQIGIVSINNIMMGSFSEINLYSGICFNQKGFIHGDSNYTFHANYLDIKSLYSLSYDYDNVSVFSSIGPYLSFGINARQVFSDSTVSITFGKNANYPPAFDIGASMNWGVMFSRYCISISYSMGLRTFFSPGIDSRENRQICFHFSYLFWQYLE